MLNQFINWPVDFRSSNEFGFRHPEFSLYYIVKQLHPQEEDNIEYTKSSCCMIVLLLVSFINNNDNDDDDE